MSKNTHVVLRKFTADDPSLQGLMPKGKEFDGSDVKPAYLKGLEKVNFIKKIGAKGDAGSQAEELADDDSQGESIGDLDTTDENNLSTEGNDTSDETGTDDETNETSTNDDLDLDLDDDGSDPDGDIDLEEETDKGPDGELDPEVIISDTPITQSINDVPQDNKDELKALADKLGSGVKRNLSFDNMKNFMLSENEGK